MIGTTATTSTWVTRTGTLFGEAFARVQALAHVVDTWLTTHRKTADDSISLANMNDRERRDIGLPPQGRAASQASWLADYR